MQTLNINVTKIDKSAIYEGKSGKYINLTLMENRDGEDQYGNAGFIVQDIGKERREAGERGPIVGNWKHVGSSRPAQKMHGGEAQNVAKPEVDGDDFIPF